MKEQIKHIQPFVDFGFKRIFTTPELLIDFLNAVLCKYIDGEIREVEYLPPELDGEEAEERRMIFDILCKTDREETIIIEMQKAEETRFLERMFRYMARAVSSSCKRGETLRRPLKHYSIAMMDFKERRFCKNEGYLSVLRMKNDENRNFLEGLLMIYIEIPKFAASFEQCQSRLEQWLFMLKAMQEQRPLPDVSGDAIFSLLLEKCHFVKLDAMEQVTYWEDVMKYRDVQEACKYHEQLGREDGRQEGMEKGREEGRQEGLVEGFEAGIEQGIEQGMEKGRADREKEMCLSMIAEDLPTRLICKVTGLSETEVEGLRPTISN